MHIGSRLAASRIPYINAHAEIDHRDPAASGIEVDILRSKIQNQVIDACECFLDIQKLFQDAVVPVGGPTDQGIEGKEILAEPNGNPAKLILNVCDQRYTKGPLLD